MNTVSGLPSPPTRLIGREFDLAKARECLLDATVRLITLTGSPGTGKTRFAVALAECVAEEFSDLSWVELAALTDAAQVPQAIAEQIGLRETGSRAHGDILKEYLWGKEHLLMLDNFEHVLDAAAFLAELLASCPRIKFVVTSRVPLRVRWEREFAVPPLAVPQEPQTTKDLALVPSVQLFTERALAVQPDFMLGPENEAAIAEICRQLDGLPLAIELAAGRSKLLDPAALAGRLERRLELLSDGPRDLPVRQRTLRGAVGWSYSLLSSDEQAVFRRLAIFAGGCEIEDAEAICALPGHLGVSVLDAIQALVDANLVQMAPSRSGNRRLKMLETIREYAAECLGATSEQNEVARHHANRYLSLLQQAEDGLTGSVQLGWLERLEADHANLLAALRYSVRAHDAETAVGMVRVLWRFWWRRGYLTEGRSRTTDVLSLDEVIQSDALRLQASLAGGLLALWQADYDPARRLLSDSIQLARKLEDQRARAYALVFLGRVARDLGEVDAAALGTEGVEAFRTTTDRWGLGVALHFLGLAMAQFDPEEATDYFHESIDIFRALEVDGDLAMPLRGMGLVSFMNGKYEQARQYFEESAALFRSIGDEWSASMVMHDLGSVAEAVGSPREAAALLTESLRAWHKLGNKRGSLTCLAGLAKVALRLGEVTLAVELVAAVDAIAGESSIAFEPTDGAGLEETQDDSRSRMSEDEYAQAWSVGRELGFERAVSAGLSVGEMVKQSLRLSSASDALSRLSPREREVAALVALGMSNRQIADNLTITEGTANLHVKHILSKLGFTSRAQIAVWTVEQTRKS